MVNAINSHTGPRKKRQILRHSSGDFDDIMLTDVYIFFYIFVYTYTCNDMRSVMLQINEYDDESHFLDQIAI